MLPSKKEISESSPPYLLKHPNGDWSLVTKVIDSKKGQKLVLLYIKNNKFKQREVEIKEPLFYVGADVWELEFGSILMTLDHPTLFNHPAMTLWKQWQNSNSFEN